MSSSIYIANQLKSKKSRVPKIGKRFEKAMTTATTLTATEILPTIPYKYYCDGFGLQLYTQEFPISGVLSVWIIMNDMEMHESIFYHSYNQKTFCLLKMHTVPQNRLKIK